MEKETNPDMCRKKRGERKGARQLKKNERARAKVYRQKGERRKCRLNMDFKREERE